jgi:hypothetical protein
MATYGHSLDRPCKLDMCPEPLIMSAVTNQMVLMTSVSAHGRDSLVDKARSTILAPEPGTHHQRPGAF